ncbi:MAG TPA: sigma-70 family RNA polymerase sigma factor [Bacteroidota bacterium]
MIGSEANITQMLEQLSGGNRAIVDMLLPLVYDELKKLASRKLRGERSDHTLNTTALVHEAYLKLVDQHQVSWKNRAHFFAIAAQAMRRILINYANSRLAQKRGGDSPVTTLHEESVAREVRADELIALDEALDRLKQLSERQSTVVEYHFFGGLKHEEIAEVLGVSLPTVRRDWRLAKAWLTRELKPS